MKEERWSVASVLGSYSYRYQQWAVHQQNGCFATPNLGNFTLQIIRCWCYCFICCNSLVPRSLLSYLAWPPFKTFSLSRANQYTFIYLESVPQMGMLYWETVLEESGHEKRTMLTDYSESIHWSLLHGVDFLQVRSQSWESGVGKEYRADWRKETLTLPVDVSWETHSLQHPFAKICLRSSILPIGLNVKVSFVCIT